MSFLIFFCHSVLYNTVVRVTRSLFSTLYCMVFLSPSPSFLTWPSSGSCSLWTLADVSTSGYDLPHIYNKPPPPLYLEAVMFFLFLFFLHWVLKNRIGIYMFLSRERGLSKSNCWFDSLKEWMDHLFLLAPAIHQIWPPNQKSAFSTTFSFHIL